MLKTLIFMFLFVTLFSLSPFKVFAHPGNTAADGCHYCRTNCTKWGEVEGTRHCHGGSTTTAPAQPTYVAPPPAQPTSTPKTSTKPIVKPTPVSQIKCSAAYDNTCPKSCTAGNDADCCVSKLSDHSWYEGRGCYPIEGSCSAIKDGICPAACASGHDADCCEKRLVNYTWYENWGCYPKK